MQQVNIIINQILILTLLGLTGFVCGKSSYLPENSGTILSRLVVKVTAPFLIVTTMMEQKFTKEDITNGIWIYLLGLMFILLAYGVSGLMAGSLKLPDTTANIYRMNAMFGNVIYMAFPLIASLYGEKGIVYAVFYNLANDTLLWTLGIYLVNRHNTVRWKDNLKHLVNGNTLAFGVGLLFILFNLREGIRGIPALEKGYEIFFNTFSPLGKTTIYLSMIFIGLILSEIRIGSLKEMLERYPVALLSVLKLLVMPLLAMLLLTTLFGFVSGFARNIIILQLAMPCGTIVAALASQYGADYRFSTECIFVSTVLSAFTLPLVVYLTEFLA